MTTAPEPAPRTLPPVQDTGARGARGAMLAILAATVLVHVPAMGRYGWFRDELYYVSCAKQIGRASCRERV